MENKPIVIYQYALVYVISDESFQLHQNHLVLIQLLSTSEARLEHRYELVIAYQTECLTLIAQSQSGQQIYIPTLAFWRPTGKYYHQRKLFKKLYILIEFWWSQLSVSFSYVKLIFKLCKLSLGDLRSSEFSAVSCGGGKENNNSHFVGEKRFLI